MAHWVGIEEGVGESEDEELVVAGLIADKGGTQVRSWWNDEAALLGNTDTLKKNGKGGG